MASKKYDKKTPREHVISRPDTYIGDIEVTKEVMDVFDGDNIITKETSYVPGFFKTYDELIVNARDASQNDNTCDAINIHYNMDENYIKVLLKALEAINDKK